ncbi:MAG: hypothetical protein HDS26_02220 [Bacteroides sp.]|nr:hypothetical protein [Bacteroides sp.]
MIYRFKLVSDEVSNFSREIEIDSESSFLDLRNVILDSVDYSKDELDSFFLCDDDWERQEEITLEDMGSSSDQDIWLMDTTPLSELIEDEGQKLAFVFDYMTERSFFMELKAMIPGRHLKEPICTIKRGKAPAQIIDINEFEQKIEKAAAAEAAKLKESDMDADFFGDAEFNEDELPEGFDYDL